MEPATKRGFAAVENWSAAKRASLAAAVELVGLVAEVVVGEHEARAAEGVGLDDVGAGLQVRLVDVRDDVGR